MGLNDFIEDDDFTLEKQDDEPAEKDLGEHQLISEVLDEVFESGFVESLIRTELKEQVESQGIPVSQDASLPEAPYSWDATDALDNTWPVFVAEYILSDESRCDRRYQQAAARATEHLSCSAAETVKSALTRRTFYESRTFEHDEFGTIEYSAPSSGLIRDILDEVERRLRVRESDIIEQIKEEHDTQVCL